MKKPKRLYMLSIGKPLDAQSALRHEGGRLLGQPTTGGRRCESEHEHEFLCGVGEEQTLGSDGGHGQHTEAVH